MSDCPICEHAAEFGSWPTDHKGTHCDHCHRSWASKAQSHCVALQPDGSHCCRHFGSDSAGDAHRKGGYQGGGTPECVDPVQFARWRTPQGIIWGGRDPAESARRMAEIREQV